MLKTALQVLLRHENREENVEISLVLCDDSFIQALNLTYRGLDKATDVLSFAQDDSPAPLRTLGDIVISLPTAFRQATQANWPFEHEIALLTVHGGLHLLGYDDETSAGALEMQEKTAKILIEMGLSPPVEGSHPFFAEHH